MLDYELKNPLAGHTATLHDNLPRSAFLLRHHHSWDDSGSGHVATVALRIKYATHSIAILAEMGLRVWETLNEVLSHNTKRSRLMMVLQSGGL